MKVSPSLRIESLESRDLPSVWGTPWPDGEHLTLSFAPDGTLVDGIPSNLDQLLKQLGPQSEFQILQAFQTWAVNANLNVGLTSDNGVAFGTEGAIQGNPGFGDVRIGGRPMAPDVLAITSPYVPLDPYSGEVVINTAPPFGAGGYDLSTVMLHEAGHAFGIGDNNDKTSVMYTYYQGTETALAPEDVTRIQALYGVRQPDQYQGTTGNGTLATATPSPSGQNGQLTADLTTPGQVEVYKFTTGFLATGLTVQLEVAGLSLFTAKMDVLNSRGQVVASTVTTDPTQNNLSLSLNNVWGGSTYYVRVSAGRGDAFGVGSYELNVTERSLLSGVTNLVNSLLGTVVNDTLATATSLLTKAVMAGPQTEYNVQASFGSSSDVDYYRIAVPPSQSGTPMNLDVTMWGVNGATLNPWVEVDNAVGQAMPAQVFTADQNTAILQVQGLQPGGIYYVRAISETGARGTYKLSADVTPNALQIPLLGAGSLTAAAPEATGGFTLPVTAVVHLVVAATGNNGAVNLVVKAANGQTVATLTATANRARSVDLLLPAGQYNVTVETVNGSPLTYRIGMIVVTNPVGAQPTDPTAAAEPTGPPPDTTGSGSSSLGGSGGGNSSPTSGSSASSASNSSSGGGSTAGTGWWSSGSSIGSAQPY